MKIAIIYATTEGQTRKICTFALQRLSDGGHAVALVPVGEASDLDLSAFNGVILAASIHTGIYQNAMAAYVLDHVGVLNEMKTLFLSVSLSAAGDDPDDLAGLARILEEFLNATGWKPGQSAQVAGAFRFSEYDFFKYWAMRWIEAKKDSDVPAGQDHEYTDWDGLSAILDDWAG